MTLWTELWAFKQKPRSSGAKFVLVCVAHHADEHGYCYPSQKRLASMSMLSERAVRGHLAALEEDEFIRREERRSDGGFRSSDGIWLGMTDEELGLAEESAGSGKPTGNNRQPHRQQSTDQPAEVAGLYRDELPYELPVKGDNLSFLDERVRQCVPILQKIKGWKKNQAETGNLVAELSEKFANADPPKVCDDFEWNVRHGAKVKNLANTLRTYFGKAHEWAGESSERADAATGPVGRRNLDG